MNQLTITTIQELLSSNKDPLGPFIQRYQHFETGEYWLIATAPTGEIISSWKQDITINPEDIKFTEENNILLISQKDKLFLA